MRLPSSDWSRKADAPAHRGCGSDCGQSQSKVDKATQQAQASEQKLEELRSQTSEDSAELAELKTTMAKQLREAETRCAELERTSTAKEKELGNAAEIASVRAEAEISTFKVKAELATAENERLAKIVERLEQDKSAAKEELTNRKTWHRGAHKDVAVLEERVRNLEGQVAETTAEKKEATSLLAAMEKELRHSRLPQQRRSTHEAAVVVLEKQIETLQTELETVRTTASATTPQKVVGRVAAMIAKRKSSAAFFDKS